MAPSRGVFVVRHTHALQSHTTIICIIEIAFLFLRYRRRNASAAIATVQAAAVATTVGFLVYYIYMYKYTSTTVVDEGLMIPAVWSPPLATRPTFIHPSSLARCEPTELTTTITIMCDRRRQESVLRCVVYTYTYIPNSAWGWLGGGWSF